MPRVMREAKFFWKMPRYTTSQIRADIQFLLGRSSSRPDTRLPAGRRSDG
jgi:hypothetical protein